MGPLKLFILFYFFFFTVNNGSKKAGVESIFIVEKIIMYFFTLFTVYQTSFQLQVPDLKGILYSILSYLLLGLLGRCHLLWQVAKHKERLVRSDTNKLTRVGPKDLKTEREDTLSDSDEYMTGD